MRRLRRHPLSPETLEVLEALYAKVHAVALATALSGANDATIHATTSDKTLKLWDDKSASQKRKRAFEEIRETLGKMASGRERCMYCEDSEGTDIEHFWPKGDYPYGAFIWENYLLACSFCNSNCKRTAFPLMGDQPMLLNPIEDDPCEHLQYQPSDGRFRAIGPKGAISIDIFDLNGDIRGRTLSKGRKHTMIVLQLLLLSYEDKLTAGKEGEAKEIQAAILGQPFSSVLAWLIDIAQKPEGGDVLKPRVPAIVHNRNLRSWL